MPRQQQDTTRITQPTSANWSGWLQQTILWIGRHHLLLGLLSFAAGAYSFANMQRSQLAAQWLAILLGAGWLLMLLETPLTRWVSRYRWSWISQPVMRYAMQSLHEYSLFFCLPFLFYTTTWHSGQAIFTGFAVIAALCVMWDPIYYGVIATRSWLHFALHAFTAYIAALTVPPLLWQLTTTQSLALASVSIGVFSLPSLAQHFDRRRWLHRGLLLLLAAILGGASWLLRFWVPPATLWVSQPVISRTLNADQRQPGQPLTSITLQQLRASGLYAYTPIHAPRGLHERIVHRWLHDGKRVDEIPLTITGGRKQGYRAWSYKRSFPADALGHWRVQVVTHAGQLIGELRFRVVQGAPAAIAPAASTNPPVNHEKGPARSDAPTPHAASDGPISRPAP